MIQLADDAQVRLHARLARMPDGLSLEALARTRSLAAALEVLRRELAPDWAAGLHEGMDAHALEAALRAHFVAEIERWRRWLPAALSQALRWCQSLVDLPRLRHRLLHGVALEVDPDLAAWARHRAPRIDVLDAAWWEALMQRLPRHSSSEAAELATLQELLFRHRLAFAALPAGHAWLERQALSAALSRRRRRDPLSPWLWLDAVWRLLLSYEWLRGELVRRALALPEPAA